MGLADEPRLYQSTPGKQIMNTVTVLDQSATTALSMALDVLKMALDGTLPRSVYDQMSTEVSGTTYTFTFRFSEVRQFIVTVTDPTGTPGTSIEEINNLILETGVGSIILEDGFELLLEG